MLDHVRCQYKTLPREFILYGFGGRILKRGKRKPVKMVLGSTGTRRLFITKAIEGGAGRVLDTEPEIHRERRRCNPPLTLHTHNAAAELPARCASVKAVDLTAHRTIVVRLVCSGVEGKNTDMG